MEPLCARSAAVHLTPGGTCPTAAGTENLLSGRSPMPQCTHRCVFPEEGDLLVCDLFGAGAADVWADEPDICDGPSQGWGGTPLPLCDDGPQYLPDGKL